MSAETETRFLLRRLSIRPITPLSTSRPTRAAIDPSWPSIFKPRTSDEILERLRDGVLTRLWALYPVDLLRVVRRVNDQ